MTLYATGACRAEVATLKVSDIDSRRMVFHIRAGKGRKDHGVMLSPRLLDALRLYWRSKRPRVYLFPSSKGHRGIEQPISDKTIWNVYRSAARREAEFPDPAQDHGYPGAADGFGERYSGTLAARPARHHSLRVHAGASRRSSTNGQFGVRDAAERRGSREGSCALLPNATNAPRNQAVSR